MERKKSRHNRIFTKFLFLFAVFAISGGAIGWGSAAIIETHSRYAVAASAMGDIGVLSRRVVTLANKLQFAENEQAYHAILRKVKALVRGMEIKHLSLFRGDPGFRADNPFATKIKTIYFAAPVHTIVQVRNFLDDANLLLEVPYKEFTPANSHLASLKTAIQGRFIQTVSHTIRAYKNESESRILQIVIYLISGLGALYLVAFLRYIFLLQNPAQVFAIPQMQKSRGSVTTLLKGLSLFPMYGEERPEGVSEGSVRPAIPVSRRLLSKKRPLLPPVEADVTG